MTFNPFRRAMLLTGLGSAFTAHALPAKTLVFPRDYGSHPDFRTEWWYVTGHAKSGARELGFQVTFFRSRVPGTQGMQSKFAAKQVLFAHAAVTDVQGKKLLHDQRILREGFDVANASSQDTRVQIKDWSLVRDSGGRAGNGREGKVYKAVVAGDAFRLALQFQPTQAVLLQGDAGLSRKGPEQKQASYYYSEPQLATQGVITVGDQALPVTGTAWLDHEWSQELLHPQAVGWDWIGMNLFDGSSVMAFQVRDKDGKPIWDGGVFRTAKGERFRFLKGEVLFSRQRSWKSPLSQASYPVEWIVRTPADFYTVKAVIPNQELDSRASTGAIYWEGLSDLYDSNGNHVGRGYLEMTGYARPLNI
jgi:predicted secreted hydrolase